jgi:hypothetical protein
MPYGRASEAIRRRSHVRSRLALEPLRKRTGDGQAFPHWSIERLTSAAQTASERAYRLDSVGEPGWQRPVRGSSGLHWNAPAANSTSVTPFKILEKHLFTYQSHLIISRLITIVFCNLFAMLLINLSRNP